MRVSASSITEMGRSRDLIEEASECMLVLLGEKAGLGDLAGMLLLLMVAEVLNGLPDSSLPIILKR